MSDERDGGGTRGAEGLAVGALSLVSELASVLPRLAERTAAQAELARRILAHAPCVGSWFRTPTPVDVPEHEARQPIDVLRVVADTEAAGTGDEAGDGPADRPEREETAATNASAAGPSADDAGAVAGADRGVDGGAAAGPAVPAAAALAIPEYDSLAASQVVPRLATLSSSELAAVGAYEKANRRRQTILNRVAQLLSD
jgi:hypothetical protein